MAILYNDMTEEQRAEVDSKLSPEAKKHLETMMAQGVDIVLLSKDEDGESEFNELEQSTRDKITDILNAYEVPIEIATAAMMNILIEAHSNLLQKGTCSAYAKFVASMMITNQHLDKIHKQMHATCEAEAGEHGAN